jgi:acetylglutamate kinase
MPRGGQVFLRANLDLTDAIERAGVRARPITCGVFAADIVDRARLGLVGQVTNVNVEPVHRALSLSQVPVLSCMGESAEGQVCARSVAGRGRVE